MQVAADPASFRDPDSTVFYSGGRVLRGLSTKGAADWHCLIGTPFFQRSQQQGRLVPTGELGSETQRWSAVLEHLCVPFVSYPFEWTFGMLRDAAGLHLQLLVDALGDGLTMKDGYSYNVQWWGARPVFIDVSSFTPADNAPWAGYRQFCESFLNPLLLQALFGVDFHAWLRGRLEGIPVSEMRRLLRPRHLLRPGVVSHVILHDAMGRRASQTSEQTKAALRDAGFDTDLARGSARRLLGVIDRLRWRPSPSQWSNYAALHGYSEADREQKSAFVRQAVGRTAPGTVWDLGSNDGKYARLAAESGHYVVAVDSDHATVEALYQSLRGERNQRILPLVMNLADPTPGLGWRGAERRTLEGRGRPALVLCLALVHHLALGSNVPLDEVVTWLRSLEAAVVVEFPAPDDPMVRRMLADKPLRGRTYSTAHFEACLDRETSVLERMQLPSGTRTLYYAVPR